ncbi:MAG TPA: hypothetical protein VHU92_08715 [Streptosporangiaceae bacterium]|nr:hypothetical protein [Streptosporangiaceae bacterium]
MSNWPTTVADLATGAGTLVLAVATFASVRSANRSTATAQEALQAGLRPVMMNSRFQDPRQKVMFGDGRWVHLPGGAAAVEIGDNAIYLALSPTSTEAAPPGRCTQRPSPNMTFCRGSVNREFIITGRRPACRASWAVAVDRLAERTEAKVATASTSVPAPVARSATVVAQLLTTEA